MSVWSTAKVWGANSKSSDRALLPKGDEPCHICGEDDMVEIKLQPCGHEICLECCNTMRAQIVFKADAGLKCPFCRNFVDGLTDMKGRPDTIPDLVEANVAARKSMVARKVGVEKTVSTSVPDPQRLVPPVAPRAPAAAADAGWTCAQCRHVNGSNRPECSRCRAANPALARATLGKDLLLCSADDVVKAACERHHPSLNKAFLEAGTPWANGAIGGTSETIRRALKCGGHERLMRVIHLLTAANRLEQVSLDFHGNYAVQDLLDAAHKLRVEAYALNKQKALPPEEFASLPPDSPCTSLKAYSELLRALAPALRTLGTSDKGVFVLVKLVKLGSPLEVIYIADQAAPFIVDWAGVKDGLLAVNVLVERLAQIAVEGGTAAASAPKAAEALARVCAHFLQHNKALVSGARHQHLGPTLANMVQGALPHPDAFKVAYQLALNAPYITLARSGCATLESLTRLKAADLRCREMVRDIACYTAKALQGQFAQLAARLEQGGARLLIALVSLLAAEREDDWVKHITAELVAAGGSLRGDQEALGALAHCLALPLWSPPELQQHWAALADMPLDVAELRRRVQAAEAGQQGLAPGVHQAPCEVQPASPPEALRRFPHYMRQAAAQAPRHSMLPKAAPQQQAGVLSQQQPEQRAAAARAPPPGFTGVATSAPPPPPPPPPPPQPAAQAAAASRGAPPGFAAAAPAAGAPNGIVFPNGARVPMPQPYSTSAAPGASSSGVAADGKQLEASSSHISSAAAGAPLPPPPPPSQAPAVPELPQQPAAAAAPVPSAPQPEPPAAASAPVVSAPPTQHAPTPSLFLNFAAAPFSQAPTQQQQQQQPAQPQPLLPPVPPAALSLPAQQPPQQPGGLPPHLQALPPHLQRQQAAGSAISGGGVPGPTTPPLRHPAQPAAGEVPHAPPAQQLPPPLPSQLLPHAFGGGPAAAPASAAPVAAAPPPVVRPAAPSLVPQQPPSQPQPPRPAVAAASLAEGGFGSLTEMLNELTSLGPPQQQPAAAPRPAAYRPAMAYRPAYRPPGAGAGASSLSPAAAAFSVARGQPAGVQAAAPASAAHETPSIPPSSPAAIFPMPGGLPPPRAPAQHAYVAAASSAPPAAAGSPWSCKVCTYRHEGAEAQYLACALCGSPQC